VRLLERRDYLVGDVEPRLSWRQGSVNRQIVKGDGDLARLRGCHDGAGSENGSRQDSAKGSQQSFHGVRRITEALLQLDISPAAIGIDRSRLPVAAKIAFPTAGASATMPVSPAPAEGRSLRSSRTTSTSGVSRKRGTR